MPDATAPEPHFAPTPEAARRRARAVDPAAYARSRNALDGAVSRLSPYLTHGLIELPEVYAIVAATHALAPRHKFVYELGWRAWFRHLWLHRAEAIGASLHEGPLADAAYTRALPADIREARTGLAVIDHAVRTLYATGYLHNHARMWLASYVVHLRRVHWRTGAEWMYAHLLDGDLASNHFSWQWVAGTGSGRPYLFNADNVARHAPPDWHVPGSALDTDYATLEAIARGGTPLPPGTAATGVQVPALADAPPAAAGFTAPDPRAVAGRELWLVHPWALGDVPDGLLPVAVCVAGFHAARPWSARRWSFVAGRQQALAQLRWRADGAALAAALASARCVHVRPDPHIDAWLATLDVPLVRHEPPALFAAVERPCDSFSQWWKRTRVLDVRATAAAPRANAPGRPRAAAHHG